MKDKNMENKLRTSVDMDYILSRVKDVAFTILEGTTVTICSVTLDNGFSVRGESACVDPARFNKEMGEKIAKDNAINELWQLLGFMVAEDLYRDTPIGITEEDLDKLYDRSAFLNALEAAGVDNWEGYDVAQDMLADWNKED